MSVSSGRLNKFLHLEEFAETLLLGVGSEDNNKGCAIEEDEEDPADTARRRRYWRYLGQEKEARGRGV